MPRVLVLGGYGNFGKRIARALAKKGVSVIVAGRSAAKAEQLVATLPGTTHSPAAFDIGHDLASELVRHRPAVLVNTCGPFQNGSYDAARTAIAHGVHYVDIADGRAFVNGISALDAPAKSAGVAVISGASTVPGLSSAVIEHYRGAFSEIETLRYGISPGQRSERGLATTRGILTYVGKSLAPFAGTERPVHGWQDLHRQDYPRIGQRWMANCDIPDLDLLPARYGIGSIRFSAGLELSSLHLGLWLVSWVVRAGLPLDLPKHASLLLRMSRWFDRFGSADGGMHMLLAGRDHAGRSKNVRWFIIARNGDGPQIPTIPAIVLAERLATSRLDVHGAMPCVGLVTLPDYLEELRDFAVETHTEIIDDAS